MPALPDDIYAGSRDAVNATWESAVMAGRYPSARDGTAEPAEGFFDQAANAQTIVNARGALIGTERRRFRVVAHDVLWPSLAAGVPTASLTDAEQQANNLNALVARIEIDLENETTSFELYG